MEISTPKNKKENYVLYHKGFYGNHLKFWDSLEAFFEDLNSGKWSSKVPVALRTISTPGIVLPNYCVPTRTCDVKNLANLWCSRYGISLDNIVVNEIGRDDLIVIQGEVMRSIRFFDLTYSTYPAVMRQAFKKEMLYASGLKAYNLLKRNMDHASMDNLQRLFTDFPDAIIEFSTYSQSVGSLGQNTVIWEVRNY